MQEKRNALIVSLSRGDREGCIFIPNSGYEVIAIIIYLIIRQQGNLP